MATLLIGGDVCPINSNVDPFKEGNQAAILGDLAPDFEAADFRIVNLECPLIEVLAPIQKVGPVLGVPAECVRGVTAMGVDAVGIANNHIMDHGWRGLKSTLDACNDAGIRTVGAGANLADAREPLLVEIDGISVAVIAAAAHEFSIAGEYAAGANPLDLPRLAMEIEESKRSVNHVLVLLHAGLDGYSFPTPRLQQTCRFLVNRGASAVICQHSHRAGCYEQHLDGLIVYGQGNLLFDWSPNSPDWWDTGFLVKLRLGRSGIDGFDLIPTRSMARGIGLLGETEQERFLNAVIGRSEQIQEKDFVEREFARECSVRAQSYRSGLVTSSSFFRRLNRVLHLDRFLLRGEYRRWLLNVVRCEDHREVLERILEPQDSPDSSDIAQMPDLGMRGPAGDD